MKDSMYFYFIIDAVQGRLDTSHLTYTGNNKTVSAKILPLHGFFKDTVKLLSCCFMEFVPVKFSNPVYLPLKVVRNAIEQKWDNSLAYYCILKKLYTKPIIYNFSLRKLGATIKCSPTTLSHHIKILSEKGLLSVKNGNLCLKGTRTLNKEVKSILIPIKSCSNKTEQLSYIRYGVVKRNLDIQHKEITLKKAILTIQENVKMTVKTAKKLIKLRNKQKTEISVYANLVLSNKKFGSLCNRSQSTGSKLQKLFNNNGLIESNKNVVKYSDDFFSRKRFFSLELDAKYFLSNKGIVYRRLPNRILPLNSSM